MEINKPYDEELYCLFIELLATWAPNAKLPFSKSREPLKVHVTEYERMYLMMSLKPVSSLYKAETLELFFLPLYQALIAKEMEMDKKTEGAKVQFAEVIHDFVLNVIPD